ncbi:DNA recombination protein RmuC [Patescibacteria group bacterium]
MQTLLLAIVFAALVATVIILLNVLKRLKKLGDSDTTDRGFVMLNQNIQGMSDRLDNTTVTLGQRIDDTTNALNKRLDQAAHVIKEVSKELGTVQERFKGFEEFSDLMHPKLRGNIGEQILSDMMAQVFAPSHYELQYRFRDGQVVDAIVRTKSGIVPIDSKFPLENFKQLSRAKTDEQKKHATREFNKMVRRHIDDISKKYILPDEDTVNFAVMYVPSENVYYHILTDDESELLEYAKSKNVLMVSPHGFFNFLRVILMGMERAQLQEQAQKIWDILKGVQQETGKFGNSLGILSRHVTNAKSAMDNVHSGYAKLTGKLDQVNLLEESTAEKRAKKLQKA